jgi:hypothetical protein
MKKIVSIPLALVAGIVVINAANGGGSDETASAKPAAVEAPADAAAPAEAPAAAPAEAAPAAAPAEPALAVSAREMIDVLEGNALNAKKTYEGKQVTVTGFVGNIDASGDHFSLDPEPEAIIFTGVQVQTGKKFQDQLASFSAGQAVTVTGKITNVGEVMGYSLEAATIQ